MQAAEGARAAAAAVAFLTRVPVGNRVALDARDVARGAVLFPLVGAGVGAAAGGAALLMHPWVPALGAAAVAIAVELILTGGLHVDGLADSADGLGARSRERALEIMRDPRIGAFGAAAIVIDLLARAGAIAALLDGRGALVALVVAGALGRAAALSVAAALPYARESGGSGSVLSGSVGWVAAAGGALTAVVLTVLLAGLDGLGGVFSVAVTAGLLALYFRRRLGGVTGDTLGAVTELCGAVALLVLVALL